MPDLLLHPDPAAPAARGYAEPKLGPSPVPACDPGLAASYPRIYSRHRETGHVFEEARGVDGGLPRALARYRRELPECWEVWAETRSRRMILPR